MPNVGDKCLVVQEDTAISQASPSEGGEAIIHSSDVARAEGSASEGSEVVLVGESLAHAPLRSEAVIWYTYTINGSDEGYLYELDYDDLSVVRQKHITSNPNNLHGVGGTSEFIVVGGSDGVYELSTGDFSSVRKISSETNTEVGGDGSKQIRVADVDNDGTNEAAIVGTPDVASVSDLGGSGGTTTAGERWFVGGAGRFYELDADLNAVQNVSAPSSSINGMGGGTEHVYAVDNGGTFYELDPDDLSNILRTGSVPEPGGGYPSGIGGK